MSYKSTAILVFAAFAIVGCTAMAQRDQLVDPQTWQAKPGVTTRKPLNEAIDHCYAVYMKGRSQFQADQAFKEYRRCMDTAGYQEVSADKK